MRHNRLYKQQDNKDLNMSNAEALNVNINNGELNSEMFN